MSWIPKRSSKLISWLLRTLGITSVAVGALYLLNWISYSFLKQRILRRQKWDLNICCGKTDGGGVNVDVVKHGEVPNYVQVDDIYDLPFEDEQFHAVFCSHTIEHVEDPGRFFGELRRVGREVVLVVPPLWDISAALNVLEHKWIFLTLTKEHRSLPRHIRMPLARQIHGWFGQRIRA